MVDDDTPDVDVIEAIESNPTPDRDESGRFARGWRGGPGRPPKAREQSYVAAFKAACTADDLIRVVEKVKAAALDGDIAAARLLFSVALPPELRIDLRQTTHEFRVAGMSREEIDRVMFKRLLDTMEEQDRERWEALNRPRLPGGKDNECPDAMENGRENES